MGNPEMIDIKKDRLPLCLPSGGHYVRSNPVNLTNNRKRAVQEPSAKQRLCKAEIKRKNVWLDRQEGDEGK